MNRQIVKTQIRMASERADWLGSMSFAVPLNFIYLDKEAQFISPSSNDDLTYNVYYVHAGVCLYVCVFELPESCPAHDYVLHGGN